MWPPAPEGTTMFNHPEAGELTLAWDALTCVADPDQQLIVWSAEPDSRTYEGLRFLSSWAATQHETPRSTPSADGCCLLSRPHREMTEGSQCK